eukprot:3562515-Prymnesium_polylepis.1
MRVTDTELESPKPPAIVKTSNGRMERMSMAAAATALLVKGKEELETHVDYEDATDDLVEYKDEVDPLFMQNE